MKCHVASSHSRHIVTLTGNLQLAKRIFHRQQHVAVKSIQAFPDNKRLNLDPQRDDKLSILRIRRFTKPDPSVRFISQKAFLRELKKRIANGAATDPKSLCQLGFTEHTSVWKIPCDQVVANLIGDLFPNCACDHSHPLPLTFADLIQYTHENS